MKTFFFFLIITTGLLAGSVYIRLLKLILHTLFFVVFKLIIMVLVHSRTGRVYDIKVLSKSNTDNRYTLKTKYIMPCFPRFEWL